MANPSTSGSSRIPKLAAVIAGSAVVAVSVGFAAYYTYRVST